MTEADDTENQRSEEPDNEAQHSSIAGPTPNPIIQSIWMNLHTLLVLGGLGVMVIGISAVLFSMNPSLDTDAALPTDGLATSAMTFFSVLGLVMIFSGVHMGNARYRERSGNQPPVSTLTNYNFAEPAAGRSPQETFQSSQVLAVETRRELLIREMSYYIRQGYRVMSQTDTSAQLVKPKEFSCLIATIALLLALFPFILYILFYMAQKDRVMFIEIDPYGHVIRRG